MKCPICDSELIVEDHRYYGLTHCNTLASNFEFNEYYGYKFHYILYADKTDLILTDKYMLCTYSDKYKIFKKTFKNMCVETGLYLDREFVIDHIKNIDNKIKTLLVFK